MMAWLGMLISGAAQTFSGFQSNGKAIEPPPASGIQDSAGIFRRNPAMLSKVTEDFAELKRQHGFQIYLVVESVLVTGTVQQMAAELQQAWLPKGDGIVLVFEVDTRSLAFGQGFGPDLERDPMPGQVPAYETTNILTRLVDNIDRTAAPEVFLESLVSTLVKDYNDYYKRKEVPVPQDRTVRLGLIVVGGTAALALIALALAWTVKRASSRAGGGGKYFFPETEAVERLGAPYGGGEVSFRRFGKDVGGRS